MAEKKQIPSILCRRHEETPKTKNPRPLKYYEVQENENGERKLIESTPVAPSMAEDFSVIANSMYNRSGRGQYRISTDPVDMPEKLNEML